MNLRLFNDYHKDIYTAIAFTEGNCSMSGGFEKVGWWKVPRDGGSRYVLVGDLHFFGTYYVHAQAADGSAGWGETFDTTVPGDRAFIECLNRNFDTWERIWFIRCPSFQVDIEFHFHA